MPPFSEVARIEAAIKNKSAKELGWALWYCRMRRAVPSARPADLRYWSEMEEKVARAMGPVVEVEAVVKREKPAGRGLGIS